MESNLNKRCERHTNAQSARKRLIVQITAVIISVTVFMGITAVLIAATPAMDDEMPILTADIGPTRIEAPLMVEDTSLPPRETDIMPNNDDIVVEKTASIIAAAPRTEAVSEPVTEPVTELATEAVTEAVMEPVTEAVTEAVTEPVTEPVTEAVTEPVTEPVTETEPAVTLPLPDPSTGRLVDELGIIHTVEAPGLKVTEEEITLCATIIQLEVMGSGSSLYRFDDVVEKYWEMLSVAQCIRNRVKCSMFPGSVKEVILQNHTTKSGKVIYQFSPADVLGQYTPTAEAVTAAREVLCDGVTVLPANYYYFCASRIESSFEKTNDYMLGKTADGTYDKTVGHLTTFYAGRK